MIKYSKENIFTTKADIIINTVNCVGVMGAGIAYFFKKKYPAMFEEYKVLCDKNEIEIGKLHVYDILDEMKKKVMTIINFPTKNHYKKPSKYKYIELGLRALREYLIDNPGKKISIPALGCRNGKLEWEKVKKLIEKYLSDLSTDSDITVFEPDAEIEIK